MDRSLGDIVAELLTGCSGPTDALPIEAPESEPRQALPVMYPHPDTPAWFPVHDEAGKFTGRYNTNCETWGRLNSIKQLAPAIAEHLSIPVADVLGAVSVSSDNLLPLADSREGFALLALYVAKVAGVDHGEGYYMPTAQ